MRGCLMVLVALLVAARAALGAEVLVLEAPPLRFFAAPGYEALSIELASRAPADVQRACQALGLPEPHRIDVHVLPRQGSVNPASLGLGEGPEWAGGWAMTDRAEIVLRSAGPDIRDGDVATTLRHEIVHAVITDALGPARHAEMPRWFEEGVAAHVAAEWRLAEAAHVAGLSMAGRHVDLSALGTRFPHDAGEARLVYLESFAFVRWLVDRSGDDALRAVFAGQRRGLAFRTSFRDAFGASAEEDFEAEWRTDFLWQYRWIPIATSSATLWAAVTGLFVAAGVVKRRRTARRLREMEIEQEREDALAALLAQQEHEPAPAPAPADDAR